MNAAGLAIGTLLALSLLWQPAAAAPAFGGPFTLTGSAGQTVTQTDFRGHYLLLFFGYTNCPDLCPVTLYKLAKTLTMLGPARHIETAFISIDPIRDTPAIASRYARLFSADMIGLTGTAAQLRDMEAHYHVYVGPTDPRTGAIAHSSLIYVLGPDGRFLDALPDDDTAATLAKRIASLMTN